MPSQICVITAEKFAVSEWSGGKTTQIAIEPPDALYKDREFLWRLSSATVETDCSDFTSLPDYTRLISVIKGEMILTHGAGKPLRLLPDMIYSFDGAVDTHSEGRCTDYNLMLRKGRCEGSLQSMQICAHSKVTLSFAEASPKRFSNSVAVLFCAEGSAEITGNTETVTLNERSAVFIEDTKQALINLKGISNARLMIAMIDY